MPHPSTRRNALGRHWQDYSDDSFPCKDLIEAVFKKTINPSLVLHQVRRNIALISAEDIHYDPASVSEKEFKELMIPFATSSACIHGIKRLVYADPQTIKPHILNQAMDLWPRLLPWIMVFFNQVVLRRPELFNDVEKSDPDMLLTYSRTGAISGLALSSVMLRLPNPSILHNSQNIMSCVAHVWIVASEHRLVCLSELVIPFFEGNKALTKMLVQIVKQELPVTRLTSVLSRLIRDIDCVDIAWDVIRDDLSVVRVLSDEDSSLGLSFRLAKSTPWMCYILSRAVEAHMQVTMGEHPDRLEVITKCLFCIQLALLRGPLWIVQALRYTHFLPSLLKCCLINPPAYLCIGLSQILYVITTNLIWRTVLRQVQKSLRKMDISAIDSPGFPSELAKSWTTLLDVANHRWETRARLHGDYKPNFCMNIECKSVDETGNMEAALHRCSGCGLTFCSQSCQKAAGDTHRVFCRQERIRRRKGYPEDVVLRDEPLLHCILLTDLQHEKEQIEEATSDFYARLGFDNGVPAVTCMDYQFAPMKVSVGNMEKYKTSVDPTEWKREVERAKRSQKKGKLVFSIFPCGSTQKTSIEWITLW
ncbi:uncharacterized protein EV420DRAFT_761406 [Desarmillaria tabescens]|uniref:MYND-type domain-containing protein n=1 Tax=Armillaria tabescens TaxID=1929756 RepID=A0AA39JVJ8_ARMTA|nr:uncharacterized protein EV420DRAFT_761406 [Desarmillaria tabescens]KAK0449721.1 hypothetical protein EV420DRAFT_761406 [Desarmillaria tabescens]